MPAILLRKKFIKVTSFVTLPIPFFTQGVTTGVTLAVTPFGFDVR